VTTGGLDSAGLGTRGGDRHSRLGLVPLRHPTRPAGGATIERGAGPAGRAFAQIRKLQILRQAIRHHWFGARFGAGVFVARGGGREALGGFGANAGVVAGAWAALAHLSELREAPGSKSQKDPKAQSR